jgi:hypothetical protein
MTGRDACRFRVREYGDGTPYISIESYERTLALLKFGNLYFDLPEGTTFEKAQEIAKYMNNNIKSLAYTRLESHVDTPGDSVH